MIGSKTQVNSPWTNPKIEAFWATRKSEVLDHQVFRSLADADAAPAAFARYTGVREGANENHRGGQHASPRTLEVEKADNGEIREHDGSLQYQYQQRLSWSPWQPRDCKERDCGYLRSHE